MLLPAENGAERALSPADMPPEAQTAADRLGAIRSSPLFDPAFMARRLGQPTPTLQQAIFDRRFAHIPPSERFDPVAYAQAYDDVVSFAAHPLLHYIEYGQHEGRLALPMFPNAALKAQAARRPIWVESHLLDYTGAPLELLRLLPALDEARSKTLLAAPAPGPIQAAWSEAGFDPLPHGISALRARTPKGLAAMRASAAKALQHSRARGVLANSIMSFPMALGAGDIGLPVIWIIHEPDPSEFLASFPTEVTETVFAAVSKAKALVFVSDPSRAAFAPFLSKSAQGRVIPKQLPPARERPNAQESTARRTALELGPDETFVLSVGSVSPRKGTEDLVAAVEMLAGQGLNAGRATAGLKVVIVGMNPSDYAQALRVRIEALQARGVRIEAWPQSTTRADRLAVEHALSVADVAVVSSRRESRPLTVSEALALGRPVICTDAEGVADEIEVGITGLTYPSGDSQALASCLSDFIAKTARAKSVISGARSFQADPEGYDQMIDAYNQVLQLGFGF